MKKTIVLSIVLFVATTAVVLAQAKPDNAKDTKNTVIDKKGDASNAKTITDAKTDKKEVAKDSTASSIKTTPIEKKSKAPATEKKSTEKKVESKPTEKKKE